MRVDIIGGITDATIDAGKGLDVTLAAVACGVIQNPNGDEDAEDFANFSECFNDAVEMVEAGTASINMWWGAALLTISRGVN